MNQDFVKFDKFDGYNYTAWVDKMKFTLISLDVYYVLDPNLAPIPENPIREELGKETDLNVIAGLEKQRMVRKEDEALCYKFIKNSLSDRLCNMFALVTDPVSLWKALENKYKATEHVINRRLVCEYLKFQIVDGKSITDLVRDLQFIVYQLKHQSICIPEEFQIGVILTKLPPSWKRFSERMMYKPDNFSLNSLLKSINNKDKGIQESSKSRTTNLGVKRNNFKKTAKPKQPRNVNMSDDEMADMMAQLLRFDK